MQINPSITSVVQTAVTDTNQKNRVEQVASQASVVAGADEKNAKVTSSNPASREQLEQATDRVRDFVQPITRNLNFSIDKDTDQLVVKVIDTETKTVIRQIPSEEMLAIAKALDNLQGLLVRQKA